MSDSSTPGLANSSPAPPFTPANSSAPPPYWTEEEYDTVLLEGQTWIVDGQYLPARAIFDRRMAELLAIGYKTDVDGIEEIARSTGEQESLTKLRRGVDRQMNRAVETAREFTTPSDILSVSLRALSTEFKMMKQISRSIESEVKASSMSQSLAQLEDHDRAAQRIQQFLEEDWKNSVDDTLGLDQVVSVLQRMSELCGNSAKDLIQEGRTTVAPQGPALDPSPTQDLVTAMVREYGYFAKLQRDQPYAGMHVDSTMSQGDEDHYRNEATRLGHL